MTNTYFKEFYKASNPQELTKETSLLKNTETFNTHWAHLGKSVCSSPIFNHKFFDIFRMYRSGTLVESRLMCLASSGLPNSSGAFETLPTSTIEGFVKVVHGHVLEFACLIM